MTEQREPSGAWQGFNQMRLEIVESRAILERNEFMGLPTEPRVRRIAEMKIPTHEEMMDAAHHDDPHQLPDRTDPRVKAAMRAALRYFSRPDSSATLPR
ncbi:hypothetical protein [Nesterenkonia sp. CF4.4]|uniref:hypothetical protein n=1 Tax=Nesterenkonia sp. CF4.4 TaxID=3373079 RepID=UPI003EE587A9